MRVSDDISSNPLPVSVATRRRSEESTSFSEGLPNFVAKTTKFRAKTNFARSPIVSQLVGKLRASGIQAANTGTVSANEPSATSNQLNRAPKKSLSEIRHAAGETKQSSASQLGTLTAARSTLTASQGYSNQPDDFSTAELSSEVCPGERLSVEHRQRS